MMASRQPTDDEKKSQRDILLKYNKEDLIELLMLGQIDIWNIHVSSEKQNAFIKDIQKDVLKVSSKGQVVSEDKLDDLIKMMQTVRGIAFSNHLVCDMNMNVTEAEYNCVSNQLSGAFRTHSSASLKRRTRAACDDATSAAMLVTSGKQNFKEAVIKKMVFEKLFHERKDKEIGRRTGKLHIAEVRDRERRSLYETKQQVKAIREGKAFKLSALSNPLLASSPYAQQQWAQQFSSSAYPQVPCPTQVGTAPWSVPYGQFPYGQDPVQTPWSQMQCNPWGQYASKAPRVHDLYRQGQDLDFTDDLEDNEWEENEDLSHQSEEYENDGFMVPEISRFIGKQEMKHQGGSKTPPKKSSKKDSLK